MGLQGKHVSVINIYVGDASVGS